MPSFFSSALLFIVVFLILIPSTEQSPIAVKSHKKKLSSAKTRKGSATLKTSVRDDWDDFFGDDDDDDDDFDGDSEGMFDGLAGMDAECDECLDEGIIDDLEGNIIDGESNYEDLGAFEEISTEGDDNVNRNFDLSRGELPIYEEIAEILHIEHNSHHTPSPTPTTTSPTIDAAPAQLYPLTCPCKRGVKKKKTCWFYTDTKGASKRCKARACSPSFICVHKVAATSTCLRKQVKQRVVRDGLVVGKYCKTVSIDTIEYMYRPYTPRH